MNYDPNLKANSPRFSLLVLQSASVCNLGFAVSLNRVAKAISLNFDRFSVHRLKALLDIIFVML